MGAEMKLHGSKNLFRVCLAVTLALTGLSQQDTERRPTEQDFLDAVREWAGEGARDCGLFGRGESLEPAIPCVTESLESGERFFLVNYGRGIDSLVAYGLASNGALPARRFDYDSDTSGGGRNPGDSRLVDHACPDARIRRYRFHRFDTWLFDCGPRPSWYDYMEAIRMTAGDEAVDCSEAEGRTPAAAVQCAQDALQSGTSFMLSLDASVERMLVSGPGAKNPQLFSFEPDYSPATPLKVTMTRGDCPSPRIYISTLLRGRREVTQVEVDCG